MTLPLDPAPIKPSAVQFEQRGDQVYVTEAPAYAQFHYDWLYEAARLRRATVVGLDVVIHADNGDFHYRHEADLNGNAVLMRRVEG